MNTRGHGTGSRLYDAFYVFPPHFIKRSVFRFRVAVWRRVVLSIVMVSAAASVQASTSVGGLANESIAAPVTDFTIDSACLGFPPAPSRSLQEILDAFPILAIAGTDGSVPATVARLARVSLGDRSPSAFDREPQVHTATIDGVDLRWTTSPERELNPFREPDESGESLAECEFYGVVVRGNGATGSITVSVGTTVTLRATASPGSDCGFLLCWWYVNYYLISPMNTHYPVYATFNNAGTYQITADCECSPCDVYGAGYLTVQVLCNATVSIGSPPDNPTPSDASWSTNYSFLSSSTITAQAATVPSGAATLVQWTITPATGAVQNVAPANMVGAGISFQPNVSHSSYGQGGSLSAGTPLSYSIRAARCASQDTNTITQDVRDTMRQEYVNHAIAVPSRGDFQPPAATAHFSTSEITQSAYPLIVGNPGAIGEAVRTEYNVRLRAALSNPNFPEQGVAMTSGYRNPERNEHVGGSAGSRHQYGDATDLAIISSTISASGLTSAQLWQILEDAGRAVAASAFCETTAGENPCTSAGVDHVHVQN